MQLSLCCPTACRTTLIWYILGLSVSWNKTVKRNFVDKPNVLYNLVIRTGERVQLWTNHRKKKHFWCHGCGMWPILANLSLSTSTKKTVFRSSDRGDSLCFLIQHWVSLKGQYHKTNFELRLWVVVSDTNLTPEPWPRAKSLLLRWTSTLHICSKLK